MTTTLFGHDLRILACQGCGAPLDAELEGGDFKCSYCGVLNHLAERDESVDLEKAKASASSQVGESERYRLLRDQDHQELRPPPNLAKYFKGGRLPPPAHRKALQRWIDDRAVVAKGGPFTVTERLFFLTIALTPQMEPRPQRALLESAVEVVPDERFRQILRCRLVRNAVLAGEVDAAAQWLVAVDSQSTDLRADTEYRIAKSFVATAKEQYDEVLLLLGAQPEDVPIADDLDELAAVLRANALEGQSKANKAARQLAEVISRRLDGPKSPFRIIADNRALNLCADSYLAARQQVWQRLEKKMRPRAPAYGLVVFAAVLAILLASLFAWGLYLYSELPAEMRGRKAADFPILWMVLGGMLGIPALVTAIFSYVVEKGRGPLHEHGIMMTATVKRPNKTMEARVEGHDTITFRPKVDMAKIDPHAEYPVLIDPKNPSDHVLSRKGRRPANRPPRFAKREGSSKPDRRRRRNRKK